MTDAEKMIIEDLREMRKESNDNFVLLHQKVDKNRERQDKRITANEKDIVSFKAKYGMIGLVLIAVGNLIRPMYELIKNKLGA